MTARAEASVFWPGITSDIINMRNYCQACNRMAPSQPSAPPTPPVSPLYPFQCICSDYFHYKRIDYLVIVDRYTIWPVVERASQGAAGLISALRRYFSTFGIAEELASDGGPEFTASATQKFLETWGVHHHLSSVAFPHSNCRPEIGVKTVKRMIADNTGARGELDTDKFQRAILQYRNCPDKDTKLSPAQCLFGSPIRDFIPILPGRYHPHNTWPETLKAREEALRNWHMRAAERWSEHTKRLPPLVVGDKVRVQNQTGPHPTKWNKTGTITEVQQYDQYVVKMDGSGRMTICNMKYLRKYIPVKNSAPTIAINRDFNYQKLNKTRTTQPPLLDEGERLPPAPLPTPLTEDFMPAQVPVELMAPPPLGETTQTQPMVPNLETPPIISDQKTPPLLPDPDGIPSTSSTPPVKDQTRHPSSPVRPVPLRRSTRERKPAKRYTDHDYQMAVQLPPNI